MIDDEHTPQQLSRTRVYANDWMSVFEDQVRFPSGVAGPYGVIVKSDFSLVIPLREDRVCLVRQFRYPLGSWTLEFPQGSLPVGELPSDPAEVARRELFEETGLLSETLSALGTLHESAGFTASRCHVFHTRVESVGTAHPETEESISGILWVSIPEFWRGVAAGRITDAPSIAAMGMLAAADCSN
ncbi:NUDIX domain-containing protein [Mycetocola saprophilus]|uniref:NUDIX domain-containing protein n=1 Tax=Mycetocola saprophilus TaxID=76636 RepID=UPI0004BFE0F1|nr:NUDIX hydrolase [Mycetocola saprophilus]